MVDHREQTGLAVTAASLLASAGALPDTLVGRRVEDEGTPVYDLNGEELFLRVGFAEEQPGYVDVGLHPALGTVLVAASADAVWEPRRLIEEGWAHLREQDADDARFVAFSFPKLAVQFLREGREVALLELHTWEPVPENPERPEKEPPGQFDRWSYTEELPSRTRRTREKEFDGEVAGLHDVVARFDIDLVTIRRYEFIEEYLQLVRTRELHYSTRDGDHSTCFELRGQQTNVWCVAASVQMVLDFYRYEYTQVRIAADLGLGTLASPNGLPYANDSFVVTVLEALTSNALNATMFTTSSFTRFRTEIDANRPLVSFVPGHSRAVAGYTETRLTLPFGFRGLLVFDPWPPNAGVITRWENFITQTYRVTFTAALTLV